VAKSDAYDLQPADSLNASGSQPASALASDRITAMASSADSAERLRTSTVSCDTEPLAPRAFVDLEDRGRQRFIQVRKR
jgi:hypothetical protein